MTPILCFDIETIPDVIGLRQLHALDPSLDDAAVAQWAFTRRAEQTGREFLPHHVQRIIAISCLFRDQDGVRVRSLGSEQDDESKLVHDFFKIIDRYTPQIVSWNGSGFDLPVLHYRALIHGVTAGRYWELGDDDREFKWNNYISRYHTRHTDLMDLLALYSGRANAPLDELAKLCGFPGKMGMDGSQVWPAFQAGRLAEIRAYCETDVVNTFLMFNRFQLMRGVVTPDQAVAEEQLLRRMLEQQDGAHWHEYLAAWNSA
jgi:3'-5' exonuclease